MLKKFRYVKTGNSSVLTRSSIAHFLQIVMRVKGGKYLNILQVFCLFFIYPDGAYFISVRALNKVEFGGPMALTVCHNTPLIIDNTPPIIDSINNITYDSSIGRIGLQVNAR